MRAKRSMLCVGLDTQPEKLPAHLRSEKDPMLVFHRQIIDATVEYAVAYKPNLAFFEALGPRGWDLFAATLELIPRNILIIADAKRGDIGNTAGMYARSFFEGYGVDAITVAPYMGRDSVEPFLSFEGKWTFLLGLTSNPGAQDFQWMQQDGVRLFEQVIRHAQGWNRAQDAELGFVVGATRGEDIGTCRKLSPDAFFLVPGVGAQGGSLDDVLRYGLNQEYGLLINSSRGILYASSGADFAQAAAQEARTLRDQMAERM